MSTEIRWSLTAPQSRGSDVAMPPVTRSMARQGPMVPRHRPRGASTGAGLHGDQGDCGTLPRSVVAGTARPSGVGPSRLSRRRASLLGHLGCRFRGVAATQGRLIVHRAAQNSCCGELGTQTGPEACHNARLGGVGTRTPASPAGTHGWARQKWLHQGASCASGAATSSDSRAQ